MSILNGKYDYQKVMACVCQECWRFADIPGAIVHSPDCSQAATGAHLTPRPPDAAKRRWYWLGFIPNTIDKWRRG